jgi:hypothetical protein
MPRKRPDSDPLGILNNDDPAGSHTISVGTRSDAATNDGSGSDSNLGREPATGSHDNSGTDGGTADEDGIGDFDLPLGNDEFSPGRKRSSENASGDGAGRRRNRSHTKSDTGSTKTKETASSDIGAIPRQVPYNELGQKPLKGSAKNSALTLEFFAEGWGLLFHGASFFTRDSEWRIPQEDADELAARTQKWVQSLDVKRIASLEKKIAKWQPALSLGMALTAVIGPRIAHTRQVRRAVSSQTKTGSTATGAGSASTPATTIPVAEQATGARTNGNGSGPIELRGRPVRREDWQEVFGNDEL